MQEDLKPTRVEYVTLSLYVGLILGATIWGSLADVIGRKPSWQITLFIVVSPPSTNADIRIQLTFTFRASLV